METRCTSTVQPVVSKAIRCRLAARIGGRQEERAVSGFKDLMRGRLQAFVYLLASTRILSFRPQPWRPLETSGPTSEAQIATIRRPEERLWSARMMRAAFLSVTRPFLHQTQTRGASLPESASRPHRDVGATDARRARFLSSRRR